FEFIPSAARDQWRRRVKAAVRRGASNDPSLASLARDKLNMSRFSFPDAPGDLIGAHISTKGGLHTVFDRAAAIEASALALFAKNSNQWKGKVMSDDDVALFASLRTVRPILTH